MPDNPCVRQWPEDWEERKRGKVRGPRLRAGYQPFKMTVEMLGTTMPLRARLSR